MKRLWNLLPVEYLIFVTAALMEALTSNLLRILVNSMDEPVIVI